jgi:hypothetical protein
MLSRPHATLAGPGFLAIGCFALFIGCTPSDAADPGSRSLSSLVGTLLAKAARTNADGGSGDVGPPPSRRKPTLADADATLADTGEAPSTCEVPYSGPVTIVPVRTIGALERAMNDRGTIPVVYATEDTAIYRDGRVLTTNVEALGEHLNAVGWVENPMQILGSASGPPAGAADWRTTRNGNGTRKQTRTRRRG